MSGFSRYRNLSRSAWLAAVLLVLCPGHALAADEPVDESPVLAPGWNELQYAPPTIGTYQLPPLGPAGNGNVLDSGGDATTLHDLMGDKVVVLSFIYSSCSDINGCPLATHVLEKLQNRLLEGPGGADGIRFISLSFDPGQDTPDVMKRYGRPYITGDFDWHFLTTSGTEQLQPILESYGQSVIRDPDAEESEAGNISHVLRVYLVDREKRIRNIFSASYLHADTMFNDIRTLQMEAQAATVEQGPGDVREGYQDENYVTSARSLPNRTGQPADLLAVLNHAPLGLPPVPFPENNPPNAARVALGRQLFFDRRLSHNNTFSCAMCHVPEQGFANNELATAVGIEGRTVRRNSPTIYNVAYLERLFHDGREDTLEQQVWAPLLAHNEMGNPSVGRVIRTILELPEYEGRFEAAFAGRPASMETIGMALASYQRMLVSADSRFDRWYYGGQEPALTEEEKAGFEVFTGKGRCSSCHLVGAEYALFTDQQMHNTGIGYGHSMGVTPQLREVQVAPGQHITVHSDAVAEASEPRPGDLGLYEITEAPEDRWKYRTPSLRNAALTAPYMHDGSLSTLDQVIAFYNSGGIPNELLDPRIRPLQLSPLEAAQLKAFLESLTGSNVDQLVADAYNAGVGNTR